jgi:RNA methyltransferase, trmH family, group 3
MKITGRNAVFELLKAGRETDKVLVENGLRDAESKKLLGALRESRVKVQFCDRAVMDKEAGNSRHQGFIAFVSDYEYCELDDMIAAENGFIVLLDEVLDPHNLGSIIRVCECAGVDGLVITKHRSAAVTDTVMRISEGGANHLKIARVTNLNDALDELKARGYWVTGAELGGENLYAADLTGNLALVIGGEDSGIKRLTRAKCDRIVQIPMRGKVNSLNASVACGVVVFEAMRQRYGS